MFDIFKPLETAFEQFPASSFLSALFFFEGLLIVLLGAKHNRSTGIIVSVAGVANLYLIGVYVVTLYGTGNLVAGLINMIIVAAGLLLLPFIKKEPAS